VALHHQLKAVDRPSEVVRHLLHQEVLERHPALQAPAVVTRGKASTVSFAYLALRFLTKLTTSLFDNYEAIIIGCNGNLRHFAFPHFGSSTKSL
jgi:hypothetical protein